MGRNTKKEIWVDLDNSPHVPFFSPIIKELRLRNYEVKVTARDCAQTCDLADLFEMNYTRIGMHYGRNKILKVAGTVFRSLQLVKIMNAEKPALALSHGSRAQILAALVMGVPSLVIEDYEYANDVISAKWHMMPEIISENSGNKKKNRTLRYPGIKEDVYVPNFRPDPRIRKDLGIGSQEILVTIRPPATAAHYHNPESEALFSEAVNYLGPMENVRMVILPRYDDQGKLIETSWPEWFQSGKILVPEHVVDGLNLLWYSDLAISGGGTMNREAAALGIPVYSIFRGKIGDVDRYLADAGRLVLLERVDDVRGKVKVEKRLIPDTMQAGNPQTLKVVVENIIKVVNAEQ